MIDDKEKYRKEKEDLQFIAESKLKDIYQIQDLMNRYGDMKLSELLEDAQGRFEMAKELVDSFTKEEDDAMDALVKKYKPGQMAVFFAKGNDTVDLAVKYMNGEI